MSKVVQFLTKYPTVDGYTLICVCEELNRRWGRGAGINGILEQALMCEGSAKHLIALCESEQNQENVDV